MSPDEAIAYLRETVVEDIIQDQISAMHPYGAIVLPKLGDAAGIYHTAPRLVVIPENADRLGIYKEMFGGMMALFEIRPDEDQVRQRLRPCRRCRVARPSWWMTTTTTGLP